MKRQNIIILAVFAIITIIIIIGVRKYFFIPSNKEILLLKGTHQIDENFNLILNRKNLHIPNVNSTLEMNIKFLNIPSNFVWKSSYKNKKIILLNDNCPNIHYIPSQHLLIISYLTVDFNNNVISHNININNLPIQTWFKLVIVTNNRLVSIFNNEKLIKVSKLPNVPKLPINDLEIGSINQNFLGKLKDIKYYDYAMTKYEVANL